MTFKDIQTALKAQKIKLTIQEIGNFFEENGLNINNVDSLDMDTIISLFKQTLLEKERIKRNNKNTKHIESEKSFTLLGKFHALEKDGLIYVMLVNFPKITTISIHDEMKDAEQIAQQLNAIYNV